MAEVKPMKLQAPSYPLAVGGEPYHWIIVGAGGTGGWFIPQLARQIAVINGQLYKDKPGHIMTIIESDVVEEKNLTRQNFLLGDIHKNKGTALGEKLRKAFGIQINIVEEYLTSIERLDEIVNLSELTPVIVGCVDNVASRLIMDDYFKKTSGSRKLFLLDSGNDEFAGQVVLGCNVKELLDPTNKQPQVFATPTVLDLYPEMREIKDKRPDEMSCAEKAVANPQCVAANTTAANELFKIANMMMSFDGKTQGIRYHAAIFDCMGEITTIKNRIENLKHKVANVEVIVADQPAAVQA